MANAFITPAKLLLAALLLIGALLVCAVIAIRDSGSWLASGQSDSAGLVFLPPTEEVLLALENTPESLPSPTPDAPHKLPTLRAEAETYVIQAGDSLNQIAEDYGVSVAAIVNTNDLTNPDYLEIGQTLTIPPPEPEGNGPAFKVIPDSELVYSPGNVSFDTAAFIEEKGGYLASYQEEVEGRQASGTEIVQRVAQDFSVNPRLLLAVLEHQSRWVTQSRPAEETLDYPIGVYEEWRQGLYFQLAWAADRLNRGYYLWRVNGVPVWNLADGSSIPIDPTINAGTAAIQGFFALFHDRQAWEQAVTENGFFATYNALFGNPFQYAVEPLIPPDLTQPAMQLPFEPKKTWAFTGGPHGGWGGGSAWAALDFAPPGKALGCVQSDAWVVAVADGPIVRSGIGAVVQDLDGDGLEQTGWSMLYMHIESRERVEAGTTLVAGDRIGHPSCEGGVSTGTHLHLARRYNGEWISADQGLPFVLDGWVSMGQGSEYDGYLIKNGKTVEAWEGRDPINAIRR
jgi:murein DD-endopeptidase MepM/ murein hydrolase activator NlpD